METILIKKEGPVGQIILNRPEMLNAISPQVYLEIQEAMAQMNQNQDIRVIVLTGAGDKAFCAGADIDSMKSMTPYEVRSFAKSGLDALRTIRDLSKPVIAAINGLTLGGGCELAMACDLRIASSKARFGQPEINLGIIPGAGGTQRLPRLIGHTFATELILTGRTIKAEEAFRMGLINEVTEPENLMTAVDKTAQILSEKAPIAVAMAKAALNQTMEMSLTSGLEYEVQCFSSCFATLDQKEGMSAFLERRSPKYLGK